MAEFKYNLYKKFGLSFDNVNESERSRYMSHGLDYRTTRLITLDNSVIHNYMDLTGKVRQLLFYK